MRIADLFCGAGLAAEGYAWSTGAEIYGVDNVDQPNYPFHFVQGDAMEFALDGGWFDLVHASPPCHDHSVAAATDRKARGAKGTGWMLAATAERLQASGLPYVIENVGRARMPPAPYEFMLCGSSFGLDVRRHRKFITNMDLGPAPKCNHAWQTPRFRSLNNSLRKIGQLSPVVGVHGHLQYPGEFPVRCAAMGVTVDRCSVAELSQAIPPAFTRWIGERIMERKQ